MSEPVGVSLSYEWLPDYCFCCGIIGHSHKACTQWLEAKELYEREDLPYGNGLRASHQGSIRSPYQRSSPTAPRQTSNIEEVTGFSPPVGRKLDARASKLGPTLASPRMSSLQNDFPQEGKVTETFHENGNKQGVGTESPYSRPCTTRRRAARGNHPLSPRWMTSRQIRPKSMD